jgi:alpha,alpha-trehalase
MPTQEPPMSERAIEDHALLSDCRSAALIDRRGSIEWLCWPRFDSPSVFGRLLDDDAGHFLLGPALDDPTGDASIQVCRRYLDGSLVLVTEFRTAGGVLELTDALAMAAGARGHDLGIGSPGLLLRRARCTEGTVELEIDLAPRFEYGLTHPLVEPADRGYAARGGAMALRLSTTADLTVDGSRLAGRLSLQAGHEELFAVQHASSWDPLPPALTTEEIDALLLDTHAAWRSWEAEHQHYAGPYGELVDHSGRVLQGLTYRPTGAIVAAPTTSLPEVVGGERNWDYRYSWVRDASLTLHALWVAACPDEAGEFLSFLTTAASSFHRSGELQIMFGISGERDLSERQLDHLGGWRSSRPVRVGNGAWNQRQLDVYGELLDAVHRLADRIDDLDAAQRRLLIALADTASDVWRETDQGIWELRGEPQHFLHSKLLCWVALDRAIDLAPRLEAVDRVPSWARERDAIREAIETHGWNETAGAFTQSFGSDALDASVLLLSIVGFLPGDDPRICATIDAIDARLTDADGLVYRYRAHDGLQGEEGTFLLCTFWLAEALARAGQLDRARDVFERAARHVNDVGLLAEEIDPSTGAHLGNFPQAFSHIGLINAAWAIDEASRQPSR